MTAEKPALTKRRYRSFLTNDLLQQRKIFCLRRFLECLDVCKKVRAFLVRNDLRAVQRHLIRARVAKVIHEAVGVEDRRSQSRAVAGLSGITMTFPATVLDVQRVAAFRV